MIELGESFTPFDRKSIDSYRKVLRTKEISAATVQSALEALRDKNLVSVGGRGAYSVEDFASWRKWLDGQPASVSGQRGKGMRLESPS